MKRLAIIDGKSVFYRGYYAMPNLSMGDGTPTGGVYGFAAMSLELIRKHDPDYVCVAWDKPKTNIRKRRGIYPEYKAGRKPAPPDFYAQIPILTELLDALSWPLYELDDYEADDIMGSLARQAEGQGLETCLISSDLDMLQCLAPNTHMYALKKGFSNIEMFRPEDFEAKYGLRVDQFLDLKSIKGDSSDNIPGVPGIGEKGAIKLLQEFDTIDGIYANLDQLPAGVQRKLAGGKELAYLSRQVASLMFDAPLELDLRSADVRDLDREHLRNILKKLEFNSLLRTLPEHLQVGNSDEAQAPSSAPPIGIVEWGDEYATRALMSERVLLQMIDDQLYVSTDALSAAKVTTEQVKDVINNVFIVSHDGDGLCKYLLQHGIELPRTMFDLRQGGFLVNPLRKSRTIADVTGYDGEDHGVMLAELWRVYDGQVEQFKRLPKVKVIAEEIDFPLVPILARMEHKGIRLDTSQLADMNNTLTQDIAELQTQMYVQAGSEFNIASPTQLSKVLYEDLGLSTAGVKKGKTGYSTGQKELDKLRGQHPIIELIERFRELTKLQNTYVEALPKLVDDESRLHTTFNQDVAATGRLSSTEPNLQNIPIRTELGRKIREAFVPEQGNVFVSADYSQFELRLAAVLSGEEKMINDFNAGTDIHAKTAADVHGIPLDDVTKAQRRDAKAVNFGVLYGMGPHALAQSTGMTFAQARGFIDQYFRLRPKLRAYIDRTITFGRENGFVETLYGRRRPTPDLQSSNAIVRASAERAAANMPIQGTEADLMKKAMLEIEDKLSANGRAPRSNAEPLGWQVLQIHDSILVECPRERAQEVADMMRDVMESIAPDLGIRLDVDTAIGDNWGEV